MSAVHSGRFAAPPAPEGTVVFLIGMRVNTLWDVRRWLPAALAMPRMIRELMTQPQLGLLGARTYVSGRAVLVVQYWRSFEHLDAYARDREHAHLPAWRAFNQRTRGNSATGIFHETYVVGPGRSESIYVNMPDFGLGLATRGMPVHDLGDEAPQRLRTQSRAG